MLNVFIALNQTLNMHKEARVQDSINMQFILIMDDFFSLEHSLLFKLSQ